MALRKKLTAYNIWREPDKSTMYIEGQKAKAHDIYIFICYILKKVHQIIRTEECTVTTEAEEVMMLSEDLQVRIEGYGLGNVGVQEAMVGDLMRQIWREGTGYCRCYCELSSGLKIVMEIKAHIHADDDILPPQPAARDH